MRTLIITLAVLTIAGSAAGASGGHTIRLAQTSTTTTCMMICNSQAANCQSSCLVPGVPPTGAATTTSNATANSSCLLGCSSQQMTCQTLCATTAPSR